MIGCYSFTNPLPPSFRNASSSSFAGIGAANMKHFVLFLTYTWISTILTLIESVYLEYLIGLLFSIFGFSFVTYILSHTITSIRTGLGAIDRLQQLGKPPPQNYQHHQRPGPPSRRGMFILTEVFGNNYWSWWLPVDPRFRDPEKIFGYVTTPSHHRRSDDDNDVDDDDVDAQNDRFLASKSPPPRDSRHHLAPSRSLSPRNTSRGVYQTQRWNFPAEVVDI
jgi:hypothetical protein